MIYLRKEKLTDIANNYEFIHQTLFYQKKGSLELYIVEKNKNHNYSLDSRLLNISFNLNTNTFLMLLDTGKAFLISNNYEINSLRTELNFTSNFFFEEHLIFNKGGLFDSTNGIYSLNENKIYFEVEDLIGRDIFLDKIFQEDDGKVICREIYQGLILWEFSMESYDFYAINEYGRIPLNLLVFLGVYEEVIYFIADNEIVIGLDIHTGEEKFNEAHECYVGVLSYNSKLDKKNGCIFSLNAYHYFEIDLKTGFTKVYDISSSFTTHKVRCDRFGSWDEHYISFWEGGNVNRFGLFDRIQKEIIWSEEVAEVKDCVPGILSVKHGGNKFFAYDINNTLHVFERKE